MHYRPSVSQVSKGVQWPPWWNVVHYIQIDVKYLLDKYREYRLAELN